MEKEELKTLEEQINLLNKISDEDLISDLQGYRKTAQIGLTPHLIRRWVQTKDENLYAQLYQFFLDTQRQDELTYFIEAIQNEDFKNNRSELIAVLWQSPLDASEFFELLVNVALKGDHMTIIEVSTVIDSFDTGFEEDVVLEAVYQIGEAIDEESDEEKVRLLGNLRQIINELYSI